MDSIVLVATCPFTSTLPLNSVRSAPKIADLMYKQNNANLISFTPVSKNQQLIILELLMEHLPSQRLNPVLRINLSAMVQCVSLASFLISLTIKLEFARIVLMDLLSMLTLIVVAEEKELKWTVISLIVATSKDLFLCSRQYMESVPNKKDFSTDYNVSHANYLNTLIFRVWVARVVLREKHLTHISKLANLTVKLISQIPKVPISTTMVTSNKLSSKWIERNQVDSKNVL